MDMRWQPLKQIETHNVQIKTLAFYTPFFFLTTNRNTKRKTNILVLKMGTKNCMDQFCILASIMLGEKIADIM